MSSSSTSQTPPRDPAILSVDVETIVQVVVRCLQAIREESAKPLCQAAPGTPTGPRTAGTTPAVAPPVSPPPAAADEQETSARLLTLAWLNELTPGTRRLVVSPRCVVTPAVRDELNARGVRLIRNVTESSQAASPGHGPAAEAAGAAGIDAGVSGIVAAAGEDPLASRALARLAPTGRPAPRRERLTAPSLAQLLADIAGQLAARPQLRCVLLTSVPLRAVVEANRHAAVRGAHVRDLEELQHAASQFRSPAATDPPNLLVLNPARCATGSLNVLATRFWDTAREEP